MAGGKKKEKKELTPEERLQQALVPEEKWPYELPEGWKWIVLGKITDVVGGGTPSTSHPEYYGGKIPWLSPADLSNYSEMYISCGAKKISEEGLSNSSARLLPKGTVCLSSRAPIGYVAIASNDLCTNQGFKSFVPSPYVYPEFLYWYLKSNKALLESMASGTTFLELSGKRASQIMMPLPPLNTQIQIANIITDEIKKLEDAKEQIQIVIDSSEERKQGILHKAVTGELSAKWRAAHNVELSSWQHMPLKEACIGLKYGTASKSQKEGLVAVIRMGNLQDGGINWSNLVYSNNSEDNEKFCLHSGDVLFNRTNSPELVGKTAIYRGEQPAIYAGYLIKLDYKDFVDGEYLNYIMNSPEEKRYCNQVKSDGVNQSNVSAAKIGEFNIPVPTIDEQHEIVRIVNTYLDNSGAIEEAARNSLDQLEALKKSILTKAFRGELIC
jgi:type I restriction enzyme S subunit